MCFSKLNPLRSCEEGLSGSSGDSNVTSRQELATSPMVNVDLQELAEGSNMQAHASPAQGSSTTGPAQIPVAAGK